MKLHLGCGGYYKKGWVNIDAHTIDGKVDRLFDLRIPLSYKKDSVDEILGIHFFEHLPREGLKEVVKSWLRCLKPGAKLILEVPNFDRCIDLYNHQPARGLRMIFGEQKHQGQFHHWGWTPESLKVFLKEVGFTKVETMGVIDGTRPPDYSFRAEAIK